MKNLIEGRIPSKQELLKKTQGCLLLLIIVFGDEFKLTDNGTKAKKLYNPFYNDKNPALSFYLGENGVWRYNDFGAPEFQGDVFDFFALYFKLDVVKQFPLLLEKMWELFKSKEVDLPKLKEMPKLPKKEVEKVEIISNGFTKEGLTFWEQYGITQKVLEENHVVEATGYVIHYKNGTTEEKSYSSSSLKFAYRVIFTCYKFYSPDPKGFWYVGDKPKDFYIGEIADFCDVATPLFICGGFKDALVVRSLGYDAITLSSETATITRRLLKDLYYAQYKIVVLYDNDETGKKQAIKLSEQCYGKVADLSSILTEEEEEIKDIADFVKADLENNPKRLFKFLLQYVEDVAQFISDWDFFFEDNLDLLQIAREDNNIVVEDIEEDNDGNDLIITEDPVRETSEDNEESILKHIGLDESIYEELPKFFQKVIKPLSENHEKDLVLIGTICVLGNILKVSGIYDNRRMYPNLMSFITAPASAGKGALKFAKLLGHAFEERYKSEYKRELYLYLQNDKKGEEPARKRFFLSGNSSTSAMINSLYNSGGKGVIVEYEADVLNNSRANKTWGDFSTVLRNAYEHEAISKVRIEDEIDIECPRLSVAISGTKNQLFDFIPSVENGLFSRFMFYDFPLIPIFKDVFKNKVDLAKYYKLLSQDLINFYDAHMEVEFEFTAGQAKKFHKHFETNHNQFYVLLGGDSLSLIRRLGSMCFRIAMLLTVSRYIYEGNTPVKVFCSDNDFKTALKMTDMFIKQAENLYLQMPKSNNKYEVLKTDEQKLLEELSNEFTFSKVVDAGKQLEIPKGTVERFLRKFIKFNLVTKLKHGHYKKAA